MLELSLNINFEKLKGKKMHEMEKFNENKLKGVSPYEFRQ